MPRSRIAWNLASGMVIILCAATSARAQTDYYNTDAGRPIQIEDAYAMEHRALELQLAPLRLQRTSGGRYTWGMEPEIAAGLFPRTQLEARFPLRYADAPGAGRRRGLAGIDLSLLHNLNVETRLPALAIAVDGLLPVGNLAPDRGALSIKGIVTKTFALGRVHLNSRYTFGRDDANASIGAPSPDDPLHGEDSRWLTGIAVDHTVSLRSTLFTAEVYARQPMTQGAPLEWNGGVGMRYQAAPRWALDAGLGRTLTGNEARWYLTFGGAYAVGLPWSAR